MLTALWEVRPTTEDGLRWLLGDRRGAHRMLMSGVQSADLDTTSPREEACMTWWTDPDDRTLSVRLRSDLTLKFRDLAARRTADPCTEVGADPVRIEVDLARQYTPVVHVDPEVLEFLAARGKSPSRTSGSLTPVGPERLQQWSHDKLARSGLLAHSVEASIQPDAQLGRSRRERIPVARITATVSPTAERPTALTDLVNSGLGKGKNYGLGMIRFPADDTAR